MVIGSVAATVGTFWGGYELGTVINDALTIDPTVAHGAVDVLVIAVLESPLHGIGFTGGKIAGAATGGAIGSGLYNKFKR